VTAGCAAVVVLYGLGAVGPGAVFEAAADRWELLFGYDPGSPHSREMAPILSSLGTAFTLDAAAPALAGADIRGVATFSESLVDATARLAKSFGCLCNASETIVALTDKRRQREALAAAGVDSTRSVELDPRDPAAALRAVGGRGVLKPARGTGSRATRAVESVDALEAAVAGAAEPMVLEEQLDGAPHPGAEWLGDYVSVETVSSGGSHHVFCVTDKLPLETGFRETGFVVPSSLTADLRTEILELNARALTALGVREGVSQTEVKLTPDGPRIIEVNGRLGGYLHALLTRASDVNPVRLALSAAVGELAAADQATFDRFLSTIMILPPAEARQLVRTAPKEALLALPGVWAVEQHIAPGAPVDAATGTLSRVETVHVEAPTLDELAVRVRQAREHAYASTEFALAGPVA
jgi:biotin carboxylase